MRKTMEQPAATLWDFSRLKGAFQIRVLWAFYKCAIFQKLYLSYI